MLQEELAICRSTQRTPEHVNDQAMDAQPMLAEDVDEKAEQKLELAKTCAASFNLRLKPVDTSTTPITDAQDNWPSNLKMPHNVYEAMYIEWAMKFFSRETLFNTGSLKHYHALVHTVADSKFSWLVTAASFDQHFKYLIDHAFFEVTLPPDLLYNICGNIDAKTRTFNWIRGHTARRYAKDLRKFLLFLTNIERGSTILSRQHSVPLTHVIMLELQDEVKMLCDAHCAKKGIYI